MMHQHNAWGAIQMLSHVSCHETNQDTKPLHLAKIKELQEQEEDVEGEGARRRAGGGVAWGPINSPGER
jgi:hypothetical protein